MRERERQAGRQAGRQAETEGARLREGREDGGHRENSNSKTLFYKDCSLGSFKYLTTSPC